MLSTSKNEATFVGPVVGAWSLLMGTKGSSHHWPGTPAGPISLWGTDGYHLTQGNTQHTQDMYKLGLSSLTLTTELTEIKNLGAVWPSTLLPSHVFGVVVLFRGLWPSNISSTVRLTQ